MLGTLDQLLAQLFAPTDLEHDARLRPTVAATGAACAGAIEQYCDRSFRFQEGRKEESNAECLFTLLHSTPIVRLDAVRVCEVGDDETWHDIRANVAMLDRAAGIVHWKEQPGQYLQTLSITYAGGYWIDPTPERNGTPPEGQHRLPDAIFLAWCELVQEVWTKHQQRLLATPDSVHSPHATEFPAIVRDLLAQYRRLAA